MVTQKIVLCTPKRIRQARRDMGMSVLDLANVLYVSSEVIEYWETGKVPIDVVHLRRLMEISRHDANWFLGKEDDTNYWDNITEMANKQRDKGIKTYGQRLEDNQKENALTRLSYIEEELVDALMYLEWLKEKLYDNNKM